MSSQKAPRSKNNGEQEENFDLEVGAAVWQKARAA
jgi:hypothetical protein